MTKLVVTSTASRWMCYCNSDDTGTPLFLERQCYEYNRLGPPAPPLLFALVTLAAVIDGCFVLDGTDDEME